MNDTIYQCSTRMKIIKVGVHINKEEKVYAERCSSKIKRTINGFLTYKMNEK